MVIKKSAVDVLLKLGRAKLEAPGPITLSGVGDQKSICEHGAYSVRLPLKNGEEANLSGLCLKKVTSEFPKYPLDKVSRQLKSMCKNQGGESLRKTFPKMPKEVGGETDILLGIKYVKYFPELVHMFPSGLSVHQSVFLNSDGSDGVFGGPHPEFTKAEKAHRAHTGAEVYVLPTAETYKSICKLQCEVPLLGEKLNPCCSGDVKFEQFYSLSNNVCICRKQLKCARQFDEVENAGTEISYRCVDCRNCPECKRSPRIEDISIQEEVEQSLIDRSVHVDIDKRITTASLPFLSDPDLKLVPNENSALKIYKAQARKLDSKPEDKAAVIESENKLQKLGFVEFFDNLTDTEKKLFENRPHNYIPWRVAWNLNSPSTLVRLVFDASHTSPGGCSLNSVLAKGINSMNLLIEILIRWTTHMYAFHTDIQKMYNAIFLQKEHWRYQMYLWRDDLSVERPPQRKVIKTLIYGVKPSGNLAERGLRQTAEKIKHLYPRACEIINKDMYVDDCLSGEYSINNRLKITDNLKLALEMGGFTPKGFTFSGCNPPDHLSKDSESVTVGGLKWFPKGDFISLNIGELNFAKKNRGRKLNSKSGIIPDNLTKRDCVGKVGEIFDPLGKVTPLVAGMKLDIHELHTRKLDWDDKIPDDLRKIWLSNFELIQEIKNIRFNRAVIPIDAASLDMKTIDTADASNQLICCAIYARFRKKDGTFSCQLIFSRSKVLPNNISVPRAELMAATLNAVTGHVVKLSLGDRHKKCWKFTDSQVVLHWISCLTSALKVWVRNRVIEINRLTDASTWRYVESKNMSADIGTRKGANISDVGPDSVWIRGHEWMRGPESGFPVKTTAELILSAIELQEARKECSVDIIEKNCVNDDTGYVNCSEIDSNDLDSIRQVVHYVSKPKYECRYNFSKYLINPLKYRFRKVVRVLALVFLFISKLRKGKGKTCNFMLTSGNKVPEIFQNQGDQYILTTSSKNQDHFKCMSGLVIILSDEMITRALQYFHRKATAEILEFVEKYRYNKISEVKDGILHYSGRILPSQSFGNNPSLSDAALDLTTSTFCVPLSDSESPIARAIVTEIHWHHTDVSHRGVESVLRQVQRISYIIGGRNLVKTVKRGCYKCRILQKEAIKVAMGPLQDVNLCIAPAFYYSQVDICGHFNAYSNVNKRATIKIWFVVFCCCVTGAVDCRLMEDYSADSFVLAFIRFSCRFGYPKRLLPDEGSQLVKGCKNMIISFSNIQHKLSVEYGVEFETCPVGAHYVHGKVERKIQQIKKSIFKELNNRRLSVIQWETVGLQISNSINNMPIGIGNKTENIENLDILTPNRLLLGRNNDRCPTVPLQLSQDHKRVIETNSKIFKAWFHSWLVSYVPTLVERPKWYENDQEISVGDVILFLKSEQEFDLQYQYGIVISVNKGRDGYVRTIDVEYQNHNENIKRKTVRGVRDIVVIHRVDELASRDASYYLFSFMTDYFE